jgi:hypothetical protein
MLLQLERRRAERGPLLMETQPCLGYRGLEKNNTEKGTKKKKKKKKAGGMGGWTGNHSIAIKKEINNFCKLHKLDSANYYELHIKQIGHVTNWFSMTWIINSGMRFLK